MYRTIANKTNNDKDDDVTIDGHIVIWARGRRIRWINHGIRDFRKYFIKCARRRLLLLLGWEVKPLWCESLDDLGEKKWLYALVSQRRKQQLWNVNASRGSDPNQLKPCNRGPVRPKSQRRITCFIFFFHSEIRQTPLRDLIHTRMLTLRKRAL